MLLLDTDVMVDILRGQPAAITWLQTVGQTQLGLPGLVAMELIQGCRTRIEQQRIQGLIRRYETFNQKHYQVIMSLPSLQPYTR